MNPRDLVVALSALDPAAVEAITAAANSMRETEVALSQITGKKPRKKRGPNKPKIQVPVAPPTAKSPAKPAKGAKVFSSVLDRVKAVKTPGLKVRRTRDQESDE